MQYCENKYIRVSDILSYIICPRLAFFRVRKGEEPLSPAATRSMIYKEISRSLGSVLIAENRPETLRLAMQRACEDLAIVYSFSAEEALAEMTGHIGEILAGLERESERLGKGRLATLLHPEAEGVSLCSDKLRLSGRIDRICVADNRYIPVIVSASSPPVSGIYPSDRIRLAAYSLLVSERYGFETTHCAVEYMGGWCIREAEIRKTDTREALSIRRRIEESRSAMPQARRGKWCEKCSHRDNCVARVSFLDSLYKLVRP